jgi:hypothetical protein
MGLDYGVRLVLNHAAETYVPLIIQLNNTYLATQAFVLVLKHRIMCWYSVASS